jgi:hypothetical protein
VESNQALTYGHFMSDAKAILRLRISTEEPVEIDAFVGAFTSLAEEYRREIRENYPDADGDARIFVKEVRKKCIEADLIPYVVAAAPFIAHMDQVVIVEQFVRSWGSRISALVSGNLSGWSPKKSELKSLVDATEAIARDPNASSTLEAVTFEDGKNEIRAAFQFKTDDAKSAQVTIDGVYRELEAPTGADHERVLMIFTRSDTGKATVGKRSGERVLIEEVHNRALALMYASELAEERIKHEIREAEDNIYKKGFVVDVNVRMVGGKPSVFAVTNVHDIIDLPDDEGD